MKRQTFEGDSELMGRCMSAFRDLPRGSSAQYIEIAERVMGVPCRLGFDDTGVITVWISRKPWWRHRQTWDRMILEASQALEQVTPVCIECIVLEEK